MTRNWSCTNLEMGCESRVERTSNELENDDETKVRINDEFEYEWEEEVERNGLELERVRKEEGKWETQRKR